MQGWQPEGLELPRARTRLCRLQETTRQELQDAQERLLAAQVNADRNAYKLQQAGLGAGAGRAGKENALPQDAAGGDAAAQHDVGFIRGYLNRIAQLEKEIRRLKEVRTALHQPCRAIACRAFAQLLTPKKEHILCLHRVRVGLTCLFDRQSKAS